MSSDDDSLAHYREHIRYYIAQLSGGSRYEAHIDLCLKETFEQAVQEVDTPSAGWEVWLENRAKKIFLQHLHQFLAEDVSHYFTPMYILYESSVRRKIEFTLGTAKSVEAVDDCMQTTFERVFKTLQRRMPEDILRLEHFKGWLNTIAEYVVFDWKEEHPQQFTTPMPRTKARLTLILEPIELELREGGERSDVPDPEPLNQPEKVVEQEVVRNEVRAYVALLPEKYRVPIQLHYFKYLKVEQIAEKLGLSLGKVKSDMSRGRSMLHDYVTVKWVVESEAGMQRIQAHIEKLKDPYRAVLQLHFTESMNLPDVAVRCKRPLESVRRYLYYGVKIIAAHVEKSEE